MLHVDFVEDSVTLDELNRWLAEQRYLPLLDNTDADAAWGGGKAPQVRVFSGAYNFFPTEKLMVYLASLPWEYPDSVQLFINEEHDTRFAIYLLMPDRSWHQLCDANGPP
jgi:hypothetical protein